MDTGLKEKLFERCYQLLRRAEYSKERSDSNRLCQPGCISWIIDRNVYESHLSTLVCLGLLGEYEKWVSKRSLGE